MEVWGGLISAACCRCALLQHPASLTVWHHSALGGGVRGGGAGGGCGGWKRGEETHKLAKATVSARATPGTSHAVPPTYPAVQPCDNHRDFRCCWFSSRSCGTRRWQPSFPYLFWWNCNKGRDHQRNSRTYWPAVWQDCWRTKHLSTYPQAAEKQEESHTGINCSEILSLFGKTEARVFMLVE